MDEKSDAFDVVHITGTKGKGGTAAFTESLLRAHSMHSTAIKRIKTGLYTSPHITTERERIRINFMPLSEAAFAHYFFSVWDALKKKVGDDENMPGYLQLLALLSVHAFKHERVDVAIYEVHAGGRKDATNIFDKPAACGFTTIGLDHTEILGETIKDIAWQKSGIMKPGTPAFSVPQTSEAREVLEKEATKLECPLMFIGTLVDLPQHEHVRLAAQRMNASLAVELANAYLRRYNEELSTSDIREGIECCSLPGHFQKIKQGMCRWYLDSAHNDLSLPIALEWFISETKTPSGPRIIIFGHESKRDPHHLIEVISAYCRDHDLTFASIILTPYNRYGSQVHDDIAEDNASFWRGLGGSAPVSCVTSVKDALEKVQLQGSENVVHALITGSTHLVGNALKLLQVESQSTR
ncbi:Folylpolyglutamate synthetase [Pleurostoma richardsiae]|uniref:tetrahydrofolate synthase n=1 Tax=Pleurostoma richardsiae TaxID=41990 RepID=A0AA38VFW9_9PEZI|nr:Folylpolyglutamate synthetase [Pleurostoma richardsiae]